MASYKWDRFKFYGGYIYGKTSNPSDAFASGFTTMYPGDFRSADLGHVDGLSSPKRHIQQPGLRFQQGPADVLDRREMVRSG